MTSQQISVKEWMQKFGQETPEKPCIPSLEVRKLRAKLILEEALETIEALGLLPFAKENLYEDDSVTMDIVGFYEEPERKANLLYKPLRPDLVKIADGIADSLVVQLGTAVACGIDIEPVFTEVMRSNWSKLWTDRDLFPSIENRPCLQVGDSFHPTAYMKATLISVTDYGLCNWLVKDQSGKVIKSPSYSPANIQL